MSAKKRTRPLSRSIMTRRNAAVLGARRREARDDRRAADAYRSVVADEHERLERERLERLARGRS